MDMHTRVDLGFTSHHSEAKNLITGVLQACTAFELYLFIREWRDVSHFAPFALRFTVAVVGFLIFPHSTIHPPPQKNLCTDSFLSAEFVLFSKFFLRPLRTV